MNVFQHAFEGDTLHTLDLDGQPAWMAREIGAITGYAARGQRLVKKIRGHWQSELIEGVDYLNLAESPAGLPVGPDLGEHPLVLFRPGLDMILAKTCKPVGKRLRRFIVSEVLPTWNPGETVAPAAPFGVLRPGESTEPSVLRELRMRDKLDYLDRRFRSSALSRANRILRDLGRIDDTTFAFTELMATQVALGVELESDTVAQMLGGR